MAQLISADLQKRLHAYETFRNNYALLQKVKNHSISDDELKKIVDLPFLFYLYQGEKLIFWNSNLASAGNNPAYENKIYDSTHIERDIFYTLKDSLQIDGKSYSISVLTPIAWLYPFENEYLTPYWEAAQQIPNSTEVLYHAEKNSYPVYGLSKTPAFYIRVHSQDIKPTTPGTLTICLTLAAIILALLWLQLMALHIARSYAPKVGGWFTLCGVLLLRLIIYFFGLPFQMGELELFSPNLYASSAWFPSLGDLMIDTLCLTWIFLFTAIHKPIWIKGGIEKQPTIIRYSVFVLALIWLRICTFGFVTLLQSLVVDSKISFDLNHYETIDRYTIIAFLIIALIISVTAMIFYYMNLQFNKMIPNRWLKYLFALILSCISTAILVSYHNENLIFRQAVSVWVVLFLILLDSKHLKISREFLSPPMVLWAVFLCISATTLLQHFALVKEQETRKITAEKLTNPSDDQMTRYVFDLIIPEMQHDKVLSSFFTQPTAAFRQQLNNRLGVFYLERLKKYQWDIYLFNANNEPLFNSDSLTIPELKQWLYSPVSKDSIVFLNDNAHNNNAHVYLARFRAYNDSDHVIGKVFIELSLKKSDNETVYPELLQPSNLRQQKMDQNHAYAIYDHGKLISQSNNYSFELTAPSNKNDPEYEFKNKNGYSILYYRPNKETAVVVSYRPEHLWSITRMFSFVFAAQIVITLLYTVHNLILYSIYKPRRQGRKKKIRPLGTRLRLTILLIFLGSFAFIGVATSFILSFQYDRSTTVRLTASMQQMETEIHQYLTTHDGLKDETRFNQVTHQQSFEYFIVDLANRLPADINIFDNHGILNTTSQSHIYDKNILARIIRPDAYYKLFYQRQSSVIQKESIGNLNYQSCYMPIRNVATGVTLGYLNVPYFTSERDIREQISTIISALINVYVLVFLVSGLIAYLFTQSLTKPLQMIISGFNQVNLDQNKPLEWPNEEDEIGRLVHAYNGMVKKVEDLAIQLAHNEREGAWREMARQVAHEIKNPLTPMKLSIQYLQRAVMQNRPDVPALAERVSSTLIEQIDNLSYIASEFSNFAKLPEAKPEEIELNAFLEKQVQLYNGRENLDISYHSEDQPLLIFIDQSQLLRTFTNLLQNAVQSIPEDAPGKIIIRLLNENNNALISITDNGSGISEEKKEKIFKPYFTTKSSGTGLGLAMTKKIIEVASGAIWFESEEGKGTTFYVQFPLRKH
ncbi:hypothetical protein DN068_10370 [Taibaiella soli]|uniref:histidine kinase n=2 Tax=Taibaiella soli TaxID=1649169 RepID=A0A2W2AH03_9BACT|nr:hypothetical protein DN068_10370 [Taibaiella soli]